jgi:predicted enzyme related to lactoylglutathione lyase
MPRVIHFELPADDPGRAVKFYEGVFDWKINKWDGPMDYWLVMTGEEGVPGIDGAISPREEGATVTYVVDVPSVDEYVDRIVAAGGAIVLPKHEVPGVGYLAYCTDTEGNIFGIMQNL